MEEFAEKKNPRQLWEADEMRFAEMLRRTRGQGESDADLKRPDATRLLKAMQLKQRRRKFKERVPQCTTGPDGA